MRAARGLHPSRAQTRLEVTDEVAICYLATGLTAAAGEDLDPTEVINIARRPFREALDLAVAGHMPDSLTVAMLLRLPHGPGGRTASSVNPCYASAVNLKFAKRLGQTPLRISNS